MRRSEMAVLVALVCALAFCSRRGPPPSDPTKPPHWLCERSLP